MTDREAFVSRLILEAETPLEREAVAHQSVSIEEASDAISATIDADIRMGSPWVKPNPAEATAAVVASVKNLEELLAELERLRAIVRDIAAENPIGDGECTLCEAPFWDPGSEHSEDCPWLRATQEVAP